MRVGTTVLRMERQPIDRGRKFRPKLSLIGKHEMMTYNNVSRKKKIKKCVSYFKEKYLEFNNQFLNMDKTKIDGTEFHCALVNKDKGFIQEVLTLLEQNELKSFALNTCVNIGSIITGTQMSSSNQDMHGNIMGDAFVIDADVMKEITCQAVLVECDFELPFALAFLSNNKDILTLLVENGLDIFGTDSKGNNVIHSLVLWSNTHAQEAIDIYLFIVYELLSSSTDRWRLVRCPNDEEITPLDLASQLWLPEMLLLILNTEGVYKLEVKNCISHRHILYDISDYEGKVYKRSPFFYIKSIDIKTISRFEKCNFFQTEPIHTWIQVRQKAFTTVLYIWTFIWLVCAALYTIQLLYFLNSLNPPLAVNVLLTTLGSLFVMAESYLTLCNLGQFVTNTTNILRRNQLPATLTVIMRMFQGFFALSCIISSMQHILLDTCKHTVLLQITHNFTQAFGLISTLFFTQFNKNAGHLLIMIQRMIYDVFLFLSVSFVFYVSIANSFYILNFTASCSHSSDRNNTVSNTTVVQSFSTITQSMHTTFLLSLAILSPPSSYFESSASEFLSYSCYIVSIIFISILLVNLLIGIMGQRVTEITEQKDSLLKLVSISTIEYSEFQNEILVWLKIFKRTTSSNYKCSKDYSHVYLSCVEKGPHVIYTGQ